MKHLFQTIILFALACSCSVGTSVREQQDPVDYVNPLIGTMSNYALSCGNTYPAIAMPWGTHFWTPQTGKMGDGWTYTYTAEKIRGFKMTHQPSPWINDYGQFSIMPATAEATMDEEKRASWFSHKAETATPYYYSVYLADHDTFVELTPTERAAMFRITYPEKDRSYLVVDAFDGGSFCEIEGNRIYGYSVKNSGGVSENFKLWFVIESDTPFSELELRKNGHAGALVAFDNTERGQQVNLRVAASFISKDQALQNLKELGNDDFDSLKAKGKATWNSVLSRVEIEDNDTDRLRTFYSCLYRSVLFPRDLSEITAEGKRVHYSPHDGKVHDGYLFSDTGLWDTFRCLFALVDLLYPEQASKMMEGFANHYRESGFIPEWSSPGHRGCMVGNNSASVVAEAYLKGLIGNENDIDTLWEALVKDAHAVHPTVSSSGRLGWEYYDSLGYVPNDVGINESAARTLEYAYNDWCIYTLGKAMGKDEAELAPYAKAAYNYRNLYRAEHGLMGGRAADGSFPAEFSPFKWGGDFTEGNALHYTWSVFHDPAGLAALMGGEDRFRASLDHIFELPPVFDDSYYGFTIHEIREMQIMNMGNYAHGNQPIQHVLYLYDWCKAPWVGQQRIREVMDKFYTTLPDGYCGDEDNGQTSAWYVFSALGFYPVCPVSCEYALGSPLFKKAVLHLPSADVTLNAPANSRSAFYVDALKLNGKDYSKNYITHDQLLSGARLDFEMSTQPNTTRGTADADAPYSYSK